MLKKNLGIERRIDMNIVLCDDNPTFLKQFHQKIQTSLDKGTQRKTTENELPSLTQCTA